MTARIIDRGYRRYTGERTGVRGAVRTVWLNSVQRALGMRRNTWAKVLPVGMVLISYVPAIVFIGLVAFVPAEDFRRGPNDVAGLVLPTYGTYFGFIASALILFVAFIGPEILCTDRRTGMLGLYFASPLDRRTYLWGKALATATVAMIVTIGPPLLMLVAFVLQGQGPDGPVGVVLALVRILGAGAAITVIYTAFSLGVSSLTDRKAFAAAGLILFFLMSVVVRKVLVEVIGLSPDCIVIDIVFFPLALVEKIHGESAHYSNVDLVPLVAAAVLWTIVWASVAVLRYDRLTVTK